MPANFNNSAWFYDKLSRVVYGNALIDAQLYLLPFIPPESNILIAGGGTGWILEEIAKIHPSGLSITYVEVATNMMSLSKKRNVAFNHISFFNDAIENIGLQSNFDVVITPFLLDNFTEQTLTKVFNHISKSLRPAGVWLNVDFQLNGKWWQQVLLKTMFIFFKIICDIEANKLPAIKQQFQQRGYKIIAQKTFFSDFVISTVFRNSEIKRKAQL